MKVNLLEKSFRCKSIKLSNFVYFFYLTCDGTISLSFDLKYFSIKGAKVLCGGGYVKMPGSLSGGCYWKPCVLG